MNEWLFCNRWLREQSKSPPKLGNKLIFCTREPSVLELVLDSIRQFEEHMNSGKERIVVTSKVDKRAGTIEVFAAGSKEMFS